jgi:hypothetical protein
MINSRLRIEYFDQNEDFKQILPRSGTVSRQLTDTNDNDDWYLLQLDNPIEYQVKVGEPYQFKLIKSDNILIRSRWEDKKIGASEPTSVFILLVDNEDPVKKEPIKIDNYLHIAWGMAHLEK